MAPRPSSRSTTPCATSCAACWPRWMRSARPEPADQQELGERGGHRRLDAQDRLPGRPRCEAALDEGVELARDPAALGTDRERDVAIANGALDRDAARM